MNNPLFTDDDEKKEFDFFCTEGGLDSMDELYNENISWLIAKIMEEANRRCAEREKALIKKIDEMDIRDCAEELYEECKDYKTFVDKIHGYLLNQIKDRLTQSHHNPNLIYKGGDMLKADEGYAVEPALNQVRQDEATSVTSNSPEEQTKPDGVTSDNGRDPDTSVEDSFRRDKTAPLGIEVKE